MREPTRLEMVKDFGSFAMLLFLFCFFLLGMPLMKCERDKYRDRWLDCECRGKDDEMVCESLLRETE